jgi:7-cyano-7-deazaguanine synthase
MARRGVIVLASGGIDSTALIDYYQRQNYEITCVHFQYSQGSALSERKAVSQISKFYSVPKRVVRISFRLKRRKYEVIGRNALFVIGAASLLLKIQYIALGIHSDSPYYDSTSSFIDDCQRILDGYYDGSVILQAPFLQFSKSNIMEYCKKQKVPIELTYSCQARSSHPCGKCPSCLERKRVNGG